MVSGPSLLPMSITIYGPPYSSYVQSVRMLCRRKGITHELSLGGAPDIAGFRRDINPGLHPFNKVPVLDHGELRLYETNAILHYLDEAFPGPAHVPEDPLSRARMAQWMSVAHAYVDPPIIRGLVLPAYRAAQAGEDFDPGAQPAALAAARAAMRVLDDQLVGKAFLVGEISLADLLLAPMLRYARRIPALAAELAAREELERWLAGLELEHAPAFT